jgi:restriction endonuclease Mrr
VQTEAPLALEEVASVDPVVAEKTRRSLLATPPEQFEHIVKEALESSGFESVKVTRYTSDGGIDVNAYAGPSIWPYRGGLLQVQAKRWLHTVGRREVAELRGSLQPHAHGAIVTTSFYSRAANLEASDPVKKPIVLVNGVEFAAILVKSGRAFKI